ncbi:MAG: hypothetical protein R2706_10510 [Acidimicrobiales bacterium]
MVRLGYDQGSRDGEYDEAAHKRQADHDPLDECKVGSGPAFVDVALIAKSGKIDASVSRKVL